MILNFRDWVKSNNGNVAIDRKDYLIGRTVCLDFFIRHESLIEDVNQTCQKISPFEPEVFSMLLIEFRHTMLKLQISS